MKPQDILHEEQKLFFAKLKEYEEANNGFRSCFACVCKLGTGCPDSLS